MKKHLFLFAITAMTTTLFFTSCQKDLTDNPISLNSVPNIQNSNDPIFSMGYDVKTVTYEKAADGTETPDDLKFVAMSRQIPITEENRIEIELYENGNSKMTIDEKVSGQRYPTESHITKTVITNGYMQLYDTKNRLVHQEDYSSNLPDFSSIIKAIKNNEAPPISQILSKTDGENGKWGGLDDAELFAQYLEEQYGAIVTITDNAMVIDYMLPEAVLMGSLEGDMLRIFIDLETETVSSNILYESQQNIVLAGTKTKYELMSFEDEEKYVPTQVNSITRVERNETTTYRHNSRTMENIYVTY